MARYEVLGIPLTPAAALEGRKVGDVFSARLSDEEEQRLVDAGAIRVVEPKTRKEAK